MTRTLVLPALIALSLGLSGCVVYSGPDDGLRVSSLGEETHVIIRDESSYGSGDVKRTYTGSFPIAQAVTVPSGYDTIYLSGTLPAVADPAAPEGSVAKYGNTEIQTFSTLKKIEAALAAEGAGMGDIVTMRVYLVADPAMGKMDFGGMMKAYTQFFGTEAQPHKPARTTVEIAGLAAPGYLVEIEVVAVRKAD